MQILPSGLRPASSGLILAPFRGVRYDPERVSGLAEVTSPPYDVIGSENEDQLLAADPHNVVRIIRPHHQPGQSGGAGADAARDLGAWLADAILVADARPALYVYEQLTGGCGGGPGHLQRGLIGAVGLSPREAGIILPHEAVAPGPVAGRLALMQATQANLEPIFLLYDGTGGHAGTPGAATVILAQVAQGRPWPRRSRRTASGTGCGPSRTRRSWPRSPLTCRIARRSSPTGITATPPTWSCRRCGTRRATAPGHGTSAWPCSWTRPPTRRPSGRSTGSSPD